MTNADLQRLWHIEVHCKDVIYFVDRFGKNYETFASDRAYYKAVSMSIMQIGELANGLSNEFRDATKDEIPWHKIRGMRNLFAHNYAQMDEEIIWETATVSIPEMYSFCRRYTEQQNVF